jgi:deoxycytidylate deaminase
MTVIPDIEKYYYKTLGIAEGHNSFGKYRIIANVYKGKYYLGSGKNLYPKRRGGEVVHSMYCGMGVHAELDALSSFETRRGFMVIAGLSRTGFEVMSEPCPRCTHLLRNSNLKWVCYMSETGVIKVLSPAELKVKEIPEFRPGHNAVRVLRA